MFVFEGRHTAAEFKYQSEIDSVIAALECEGYKAVLRSMLRAALNSIGDSQNCLPVSLFTDRRGLLRKRFGREFFIGDLVLKENYAYFIQPIRSNIHLWEIHYHTLDSKLNDFCKLFETLTRKSLYGRRVRGMKFNWQEIKERPSRPSIPISSFYKIPKPDNKIPDYSPEESNAAKFIINPNIRQFLLRLAQISKARVSDATSDGIDNSDFNLLVKHGIIKKEYLIICRKDSHTICTIQEPCILDELDSSFICPVCGRNFRDELIKDIFALTEFGRKLITSSKWMLIWITEILIAFGINREQINWGPTASGEEIDIMTDAQGIRVFFELKDREFGLGDAYPFAYRVSRYGGTFGVIITTEKVANDAKKFFEEQAINMEATVK